MNKILIIDICDTIYDSNTTFDFLDYYFKNDKRYIFLLKLKKIKIFRILNSILLKVIKKDFLRIIFTYILLKKEEVSKINYEMEKFYNEFLKKRIKKESLKIIKTFKKNNEKLIIISGTYDFIAKKIAEKLDIEDYFGTVLEIKYKRYTGKILKDLFLKKENILKKIILKNKEYNLYLLTDNKTDYILTKYMIKSFIMITPKNKKFWNKYKNEKMSFLFF